MLNKEDKQRESAERYLVLSLDIAQVNNNVQSTIYCLPVAH
jgi:hypothetical protein